MKVNIIKAKFHADLESKLKEYLDILGDVDVELQYQDNSSGCSVLVTVRPHLVKKIDE